MSHTTLDRIREDHRDILGLLDIIERQVNALAQGKSPDYEVMFDLLEYVNGDHDSQPHEVEMDLIRQLPARSPSCAVLVEELSARRERLLTRGSELLALVSKVRAGAIMDRLRLWRLARQYLLEYPTLLRRRETEAFPLLAHYLEPTDWLRVVTRHRWRSGKAESVWQSPEYRTLHSRLVRAAAGCWPAPGSGVESCAACDS